MEARKRIDKKQKGLTHGDDGGKYLQWNLEMDRSLADILRSEIKSGRKCNGGWKSTAFTSAAMKMSAKYNIIVSKDNVKNHLKGWKKTYAAVTDILSQSGFNWDSGNKMITVDDENVWNEYAKTHNDASKYRYKTIVNCDDIVDLCAKDRATGLGAEHADDVSDDMSIEEDNSSVSGTEGFHDDTLKRKTTSSTSTLSSKPKKVKVYNCYSGV